MIPVSVLVLATLSPILGLLVLGLLFGLVQMRRQAKMWRQVAMTDVLTGLPNRRGLELHWDAMEGEKALILIDLVGFKAVNDCHGHIVGDDLLRQVASRLRAQLRREDVIARKPTLGLLAALAELRGRAGDHLKQAVEAVRTLPRDVAPAFLPQVVASFRQAHPLAVHQVRIGDHLPALEALRAFEADLALVFNLAPEADIELQDGCDVIAWIAAMSPGRSTCACPTAIASSPRHCM